MKIGLISDTHLMGNHVPQAVVSAFQGADMILHAGDVVVTGLLESLTAIAPVTAVHGNMDPPGLYAALPARRVVEASGTRIGLIHGDGVPHPDRVLATPICFAALHAYLLSEFGGSSPDCVVYGHTHQAHVETYRGVLMINPGSATRGSSGRHTVGLLMVQDGHIRAEIVPLL